MNPAAPDDAEDLDRGNPTELTVEYVALASVLRLVGGCCEADNQHIEAISSALRGDR
jgi:methionine synthase I (cobalamin-dependent)